MGFSCRSRDPGRSGLWVASRIAISSTPQCPPPPLDPPLPAPPLRGGYGWPFRRGRPWPGWDCRRWDASTGAATARYWRWRRSRWDSSGAMSCAWLSAALCLVAADGIGRFPCCSSRSPRRPASAAPCIRRSTTTPSGTACPGSSTGSPRDAGTGFTPRSFGSTSSPRASSGSGPRWSPPPAPTGCCSCPISSASCSSPDWYSAPSPASACRREPPGGGCGCSRPAGSTRFRPEAPSTTRTPRCTR